MACWTGTGASIAANKVPGIRAALCGDAQTADGARRWNDANVLALSLRLTSHAELEEILDAWFAGAAAAPRTTTSRTSPTWARSSAPESAPTGCNPAFAVQDRSAGESETAGVRNRTLHGILEAFTVDAAGQLAAETAARRRDPVRGDSRSRRAPGSAVLLPAADRQRSSASGSGCCRRCPRTRPPRERWPGSRGSTRYLRERGEPRIPAEPRERADAALRSFLGQRVRRAQRVRLRPGALRVRLRRARAWPCTKAAASATVIAPLLGVALDPESDELPLGRRAVAASAARRSPTRPPTRSGATARSRTCSRY